ncbi:MAG: hypothetical protein GXP31_13000 [Kiritimatiellaeota bacterium]|nr:hypothetical protein [Kiritimatiellota bacterium]
MTTGTMSPRTDGRTLRRAICGGAVLLVAAAGSVRAADKVDVQLSPLRKRSLTRYKGHENQTLHERIATFDMGKNTYSVSYKAGYDPRTPDRVFPLEGYIGMPRPTACNWYHSGFLRILLDGRDVGVAPLRDMYIAETGRRGIVDMVWRRDDADVRVRFVALPGGDHLACRIDLEPRRALTAIEIRTRCYPSYFTSFHHRKGARRIRTSSMLVKEGETKVGPGAANWWMVYYDEVFDVARGEGEGPCAMLLDPAQVESVVFAPGDYAVETRLKYKPNVRRIRLAFWEFKGKTNEFALAYFRGRAKALLEAARNLDATPAALRSFDFGELRRRVARVQADAQLRSALAAQMKEITEYLDLAKDHWNNAGAGILADAAMLSRLETFNDFSWRVKLAELLAAIDAGP